MYPATLIGSARARRNCINRGGLCTREGYTLIELMFVVFIIALVLSIAMPSLMPAMLSSQLEGSARHLANYGRSVIAYSALNHEPVTVRVDLANGEYYCLKWSEEDLAIQSGLQSAGLSGIEGKNDMGLTRDPNKQADGLSTGTGSEMTIQELMSVGTPEDLEFQRDEVQYELDQIFQRSLIAQARNVPTESVVSDVDPLLQKEFSLTLEGKEEQREEVQDALIEHGYLPPDIVIESILLNGQEVSEGPIDIEVTPIGLSQSVSFFLRGAKDEYYTVQWDPITGGAHLMRGKEAGYAEPALQ
ncbi:MAG: prepilin-type N-terminal cleavage/methylation domain-containing protein [Candidatus Hydrogenedentes bacterium]|nr:prepilin-type N-terminal cleavage/methylation domain-containing protein [Candidatus Hydrogenedentota bacterium]